MYQKSLPSNWMMMLVFILALQYPMLIAGIEAIGQAQIFNAKPVEKKTQTVDVKPIHTPIQMIEKKQQIGIQTEIETSKLQSEATMTKQSVSKDKIPKDSSPNDRNPNDSVPENTQQVHSPPAISAESLLKEQQAINKAFITEIKTKDVTRLDLRKPSGLSAGQADQLLKGTGLEGLGKAFVKAEKEYAVNAYYLIAHAAWESAWGKSRISREKNNLFGFMAYDGSAYRSAKGFKTKEQSILVVAEYVSKNYLSEKGKYYNGSHLKGMNVRYASDGNWGKGIGKVMVSLAKKTKQPTLQKA